MTMRILTYDKLNNTNDQIYYTIIITGDIAFQ